MKPFDEKKLENVAIGDQDEKKRKENVIDSVNTAQKQKKKSKEDTTTGEMTFGHSPQGDDFITKQIAALAESEDVPPILFDWNTDSLTHFWDNAVAYAAGGGAIPIPINSGVNLPVAVDINLLLNEILNFVRQGVENRVPLPGPTIIGRTLGLACNQNQFGICMGRLRGLEMHPWFEAVLSVNPIPTPLASIWCPRPDDPSGACDQILLSCALWG